MFNVSCSFPKETAEMQRKGHQIFKNSYHPDGFMCWQSVQDVQDPDKPEMWLFQNILSWVGAPRAEDFPDQASRLAFWREQAERFAEPWRTVGKDLPEDIQFGVDPTTIWKPVDWSGCSLAKRVTLPGDAAHAMPPHRGQGLNNALQDATMLVDEFKAVKVGQKSLADAVVAYEKKMRSRASMEIPISIAHARMVRSFDTLMEAPFFMHGMNKSKEEQAAEGEEVEVVITAKMVI
jgi:2-polyprenyl-6-methoxyphenol hydroxylase-like FAD-dependent oxidoreductase